MARESPMISVIVPTFNSENTLEKCLYSLKNQTIKSIEIVIVDKISTDSTTDIARKYTENIFIVSAKERTEQKNIGIRRATGKYVCFIDSDMELTPTVLEECVDAMNHTQKVGAVIIPEKSVGSSFWVKVRDFERSFYFESEVESPRFFRRDLVLQVNGFDERVIFFEESTLPGKLQNLGFDVRIRIKSEILHNEHNFSLWKHLRKKIYYGRTMGYYTLTYPSKAKAQLSPVYRLGVFLTRKRFYQRPVLAMCVLLLKASELAFVTIGRFS